MARAGPDLREIVSINDAFERARRYIRDAEGIDVLVDGNQRADTLQFAAGLASSVERATSYLTAPAEDVLLLMNAWASGARIGPFEHIGDQDILLIVGDPFTTHPRSARRILDCRDHGARIIALDSAPGRTVQFATRRIVVDPARQLKALNVLLDPVGNANEGSSTYFGEASAELLAAREDLNAGGRLAVVIAASPGRGTYWPALGFIGGRIAAQRDGELVILTGYGNAAIAARFLAGGSILPVGDLLDIRPEKRVRVAVGDGALSGLPMEILNHLRESAAVIQVSLAASPDVATIHIPGTLWVEESGHELSDHGVWELIPAAIAPPRGISDTLGTLKDLFQDEITSLHPFQAGAFPDHPTLQSPDIPVQPNDATARDDEYVAVMVGDAREFRFGILTEMTSCHSANNALPRALMSREDCSGRKIMTGDRFRLESRYGSCVAEVEVSAHQVPGGLTVSAVDGAVPTLFQWDLVDGMPMALPTYVTLSNPEKSGV